MAVNRTVKDVFATLSCYQTDIMIVVGKTLRQCLTEDKLARFETGAELGSIQYARLRALYGEVADPTAGLRMIDDDLTSVRKPPHELLRGIDLVLHQHCRRQPLIDYLRGATAITQSGRCCAMIDVP